MPYEAYDRYELSESWKAGKWSGHFDGEKSGRVLERKAVLRVFAKNGLFNISQNSNGSAYFQNGIKLNVKDDWLIQKVIEGEHKKYPLPLPPKTAENTEPAPLSRPMKFKEEKK